MDNREITAWISHWDLLRQRRARRAAGLDPDDATQRGAGTVENYLQ